MDPVPPPVQKRAARCEESETGFRVAVPRPTRKAVRGKSLNVRIPDIHIAGPPTLGVQRRTYIRDPVQGQAVILTAQKAQLGVKVTGSKARSSVDSLC